MSKRTESTTYSTWENMIARCYNPRSPSFKYCGARGITVCDRWRKFDNFLADMGEKPPNPEGWTGTRSYWSIDRINVDGGYGPDNCRWATPTEQAHNRRPLKYSSNPKAIYMRGWYARQREKAGVS